MKILIITKSITNLGGVQRVVTSLSNELCNLYDVTILSIDKVEEDTKYILNNKIKRVYMYGFYKNSYIRRIVKKINRTIPFLNNNIFYYINKRLHYKKKNIIYLTNYININKFDVVISAQGELSMYLALCNVKAKKIGWFHSMFDTYFYKRGNYYYGEKNLFKKYIDCLDSIVVLSKYDQECFKRKWNKDVDCITNIKSFESFEKCNHNNKKFVTAGRFVHAKGFDILIKAFSVFVKTNNEYTLTILGSGPLERYYIKLIKKYKLENYISIINNVTNIKPFLLESSCFIMPSRWEGLGMVMVESFEVGLPVIAFDLPSIKDYLIDGFNGFKCNSFSFVMLAQKMAEYTNYCNKKYMKQNCIDTAKQFNKEIILDDWIELINR